jgi:hypothetical protein
MFCQATYLYRKRFWSFLVMFYSRLVVGIFRDVLRMRTLSSRSMPAARSGTHRHLPPAVQLPGSYVFSRPWRKFPFARAYVELVVGETGKLKASLPFLAHPPSSDNLSALLLLQIWIFTAVRLGVLHVLLPAGAWWWVHYPIWPAGTSLVSAAAGRDRPISIGTTASAATRQCMRKMVYQSPI